MKQVKVTLYTIDELEGKARAKAIEACRDSYRADSDFITEMFEYKLEGLGYPTKNIRWSLSYRQGDGVAFYGSFDHEQPARRLGYTDEQLAAIAEYDVHFELTGSHHRYHHHNSMTVNSDWSGDLPADVDKLVDDLVLFIRGEIPEVSIMLERAGYDYIEGAESDESVFEQVKEDGSYWFYSNGTPFSGNFQYTEEE